MRGLLLNLAPTMLSQGVSTMETTIASIYTNGPVVVTVVFGGNTTDFTSEDVTVTNGTLSDFSGADDTYTFLITPTAPGDVVIEIAAGVCESESGSPNAAATATLIYDIGAPTITLDSAAGATVYEAFTVTLTASEAVYGLAEADVTVTNGTLSDWTQVSATEYTFTVTPTAAGAVTVDVAADVCVDAAGNNNTAAEQLSRTYSEYAGPYDGVSFVAAYGTRRLLTAYEGDCLLLRRSSDNAEQAFGFTASGDLDIDAIETWLGEGTGYIKTWYDQSGNAQHVSQTNIAKQNTLGLTSLNGKPAIVSGAGLRLSRGSVGQWFSGAQATVIDVSMTPTGVISVGLIAKLRGDGYSSGAIQCGTTTTGRRLTKTGNKDGLVSTSTSTISAYPYDTPVIGTCIVDGGTAYYYCGGEAAGTGAHENQLDDDPTGIPWVDVASGGGVISEILVADGVMSDANCNTIGQSANGYYGVPWTNFS